MPCLIALLALMMPRILLFVVWVIRPAFFHAYQTVLWPVLGFLFVPLTTLAYAWAINVNGSVSGGFFIVVLMAALVDLGVLGGSSRSRKHRD
jgi:hypothetical protein